MMLGLVAAVAVATSPGLYFIGANAAGASLVSTTSIKRAGPTVQFVAVNVFTTPARSPDGSREATHLGMYQEANCQTYAMRSIRVQAYRRDGQKIEEWGGDGWETARPGDIAHDVIQFACSPTIDTRRFKPVRSLPAVVESMHPRR